MCDRIPTEDDRLQPNPEQLESALHKSREYWQTLVARAISQCRDGLPPAFASPRCMLDRVPAIRGNLRKPYSCRLGASQGQALCVQASSTWVVPGQCERGLEDKMKTIPALLQVGIQEPTPCVLELGSHPWIGTTDERRNQPNYIGILALGWAYILSARLVEVQGSGAEMLYTNSTHAEDQERRGHSLVAIDIGNVDGDTVQWWEAILSHNKGWMAIISRHGEQQYLSPWSISRKDQNAFDIKRHVSGSITSDLGTPLSSTRAFDALARFSLLHNLGSQFFVALGATMTFPTHHFHGTMIKLPLATGHVARRLESDIKAEWNEAYEELPHYMTLSCNPEIVISSLCGTFWEDGVTSNMVTPWLHPVLNEFPEVQVFANTPGLYFDVLATLCCFRRPQISVLWLGAVASGLAPTILQRVKRGRPPLDVNAFPWTGCPQSFMDVPGSGPYIVQSEKVRRADMWRLLYLPPVFEDDLSYNAPPFTPWAPPGYTTIQNCALRVALHLNCKRHHLEYQCWNWELEDGSVIEDRGLGGPIRELPPRTPMAQIMHEVELPQIPLIDQDASQQASLDIFRWVTINGEGVPPEEAYRDDWVQFEDESEESATVNDSDSTYSGRTEKRSIQEVIISQ